MATKTISTYYASGYELSVQYSVLDISNNGGIGGIGLEVNAPASIVNDGTINATLPYSGVNAYAAMTLVNGSLDARSAEIVGYSGVISQDGAATIQNFATIRGMGKDGEGIFLLYGGTITNGAATDTSALIYSMSNGLDVGQVTKIVNFGRVDANREAVYLESGGTVINGSASDFRAGIYGSDGVLTGGGDLVVSNFHDIQGEGTNGVGVDAGGAATITNGAAGDFNALIFGVSDAVVVQGTARLVNLGTIESTQAQGVYLLEGGSVTNGSATDDRANILGATGGVYNRSGTLALTNFGAITASASGDAVDMGGGVVTNGSATDLAASIIGAKYGVVARSAASTITNFGTIEAGEPAVSNAEAVSLSMGGVVTNGSAADTSALIESGSVGLIGEGGPITVVNFGAISAPVAIFLEAAASVTNGSTADTTASITGYEAITLLGGAGALTNYGSIISYGDEDGALLESGGKVTNGAATDTTALIQAGYTAVAIAGATGTVTNFGTLQNEAVGEHLSGVYLAFGGVVTNGSSKDQTATIFGDTGVIGGVGGVMTVTNFGTIQAFGRYSISFEQAGDTLNVEASSVFVGTVEGGAGILDLASGTGTLSGLTGAGDVTVAGSMAKTTFYGFPTLDIAAGAKFTDKSAVTVATGQTISDAGVLSLGGGGVNSIVNDGMIETTGTGTLTLAGAVTNDDTLYALGGTLVVSGSVSGTGKVIVGAGVAELKGDFAQPVSFSSTSTGRLELAHSETYTGTVAGFSKTGATSLDLLDIAFVSGSTKVSFSGTSSSGTLTVTEGTHTAKIRLSGDYLASTFKVSSDGHGGTLVVDPTAGRPAALSPHQLAGAMAGFGSGTGSTTAPVWAGMRLEAPPMLGSPVASG